MEVENEKTEARDLIQIIEFLLWDNQDTDPGEGVVEKITYINEGEALLIETKDSGTFKLTIKKEEQKVEAEFEAEKIAECTVRPETPIAKIPVVIKINMKSDDSRFIGYYSIKTLEYDKEISGKLKRLRLDWINGAWRKYFKNDPSEWENRITEVATMLLKEGYIIQCPNQEIAKRVIAGDYTPLNTKEIKAKEDGMFYIYWDRKDGDFYSTVKKIHGSSWHKDSGSVRVPMAMYEEVLDFAEQFNFKLSDQAKELAENAKIVREKALIGKPRITEKKKSAPLDGKIPTLKAKEETINEELLDKD